MKRPSAKAMVWSFVIAFPAILLALVISALLGQGKAQLIAALAAAQYAYFARTAHGAASAERGKD